MTEEEVLNDILSRLEEHRIEYMVTGSHASNVYGLHRATNDADIVITTSEKPLTSFVQSLQSMYYADEFSALDALRTQFMFNVVHLESGFKIDFIVLKRSPYDAEAFARRVKKRLMTNDRWFTSAEDSILSKLVWHHAGGSERQLEDAMNVAKAQHATLNRAYLRKWATQLGVDEQLDRMLQSLDLEL